MGLRACLNNKQYIRVVMLAMMIVGISLHVYSTPPEHYAKESAMRQGRWVKIKIAETGMQMVTNADIRAAGFNDVSIVHVYGTGGRAVPEALNSTTADDLPLVPSVRTSAGLLFFGVDNVEWKRDMDRMHHTRNPYVSESYYFLSDAPVDAEPKLPKVEEVKQRTGQVYDRFYAHMLYEKDLVPVGESGRLVMGEDFRGERSRKFSFAVPNKIGKNAEVEVAFGAKVHNGSSSILLSANGNRLPSTDEDRIPTNNGEDYITRIETRKNVEFQTNLDLNIEYNYSGTLISARLDYIRLFYNRALALNDSQSLHFYGKYDRGDELQVFGLLKDGRIWDVTDAQNPREVIYSVNGDGAAVFYSEGGEREYVAFNPSSASRAVRVGGVANQNIHALPTPDMVIVAPTEYAVAARKLQKLHEELDGMSVHIVTPDEVYNEFAGGHADPLAIRKMLKMWYDRRTEPDSKTIKYCLLIGRGTYDNRILMTETRRAGYKPLPLWQSAEGSSEVSSFSTDDILGMLEDATDGGFNINTAILNVAVGRLPVKSAAEAETLAEKIDNYVRRPNMGAWRNRVMLIADDNDNALHMEQTEKIYQNLISNAPYYRYDKLYLDSYPLEYTSLGAVYPKAKEKMFRSWREGVMYTNYIGHASPYSWTHEKLLTWTDITNFKTENPTILFAATCSFGCWDAHDVSGAELILLNPTGGFVACITPSRSVYMGANGILNTFVSNWMLTTASDGYGHRIGDIYRESKNRDINGNKLRYCLMADPAMRIPKPYYNVNFTAINGQQLTAGVEPEIPALGNVSLEGTIDDRGGVTQSDFNGEVQIEILDAEIPVTTYGNGDKGKVFNYNDRRTRLAHVVAPVQDGKWRVEFTLPTDIENNYSPARIVAYASDKSGREAQGATESLYVYGMANATGDSEGPKISNLHLNHDNVREGDMVNSNPMLYANISDPSGINLSDKGIGHKMWVDIDNEVQFTDVASYWSPEDAQSGKIAYPLTGLSAGEHTLTLTVYDNANNSSSQSYRFRVGETNEPMIRYLGTDVNPASESVTFIAEIESPNTNVKYKLSVYDLNGSQVWSVEDNRQSDSTGRMQTKWNLQDQTGIRIPRGIYIYRLEVETPQGLVSAQARKLAVTAES